MLSGGGLTHAAEVNRNPVQMLESGPAAGALAAAFFGARDGVADLLAFDMGGTTAKLSLVDGGEPLVAYGFEAARQKRFIEGSGLPIRLSTIELIEIGAGGGSIARRDEIGLLKVGPDSAGSEPGPACYGRGGTAPTVTDANLLLGYLNPDFFAGGTLKIDREAAARAIAGLAGTLGLSTEAAAAGIHEVVNENMAGAARVHIAERGRDPRRYALVCTGGGGPVHGYSVARKLGITRLVCPPSPGVASAWGLLVAPARVDRVTTIGFRLDSDPLAGFEAAFRQLEDEARAVVAATGLPLAGLRVDRLGDGRCVGQGFDLVVPLPPGPYADDATTRPALAAAFERGYREKFGRAPPAVPLEFINARVSVRVAVSGGQIADLAGAAGEAPSGAIKGQRRAWFAEAGGFVDATVYDRDRLAANTDDRRPRADRGPRLDPRHRPRRHRAGDAIGEHRGGACGDPSGGLRLYANMEPIAMLDAVTIEILWSRITSIVDEAAKVIIRTSFSTLSNEANDFACVLTDAAGQSLAQNTGSIPSFIGTLPATVRHFLNEFGGSSDRIARTARCRTAMSTSPTIRGRAPGICRMSASPSRSFTTAGWSPLPRHARMCPISAAWCARSSRARCSRKACTFR